MTLDIQTLILLNLIVNIINAFVMFIIWRQYRKHFAGLIFLLADMVLQTLGFLLSLLRGVLPVFISIVLSNVFLLTGALLVLIGLEYFFDKKTRHLHNYILLGIFLLFMIYFGMIQPNLAAREAGISIMIALINAQTCWLLFHRVAPHFRPIAKLTGITLSVYILVSFARIILMSILPYRTNDFFHSGFLNAIYIALYLMLSIFITMNLFLMVSKRLLDEVQNEKEKYITTFHSSPYAIILTRLTDGKIFEVNEGFIAIAEYQPEEVVGKTTTEINLWYRENDRSFVVGELSKGNQVRDLEMQFRSKNGRILTGLLSSKIIYANHEKCILTSVSDITEMVTMRQKLQALAMHDFMTGLPNRKLFYDRFEHAKSMAERDGGRFAIVSMDLDKLKAVNDRFGHYAGDQVLMEIGNRLYQTLRKEDIVARFGGDEFVMLAQGLEQGKEFVSLLEKILEIVSRPINVEDHLINVTMSMGIALYPQDGNEIEELLKKSDQAMYLAKEIGGNNYQYVPKDQNISSK